jgi:hypothetical protein
MPQETNLNRTPYFDDYDQNKDFYKVLFKPGYSVQARELTTLQSILQNQIEKFGTHFFKEGSRVIPGAITYNLNYRSVQVEPNFLGLPISLYQDNLIGKQIKGSISGVIATITNIQLNADTGNIILFVNYENSGNNFSDTIFSDGENLITLSDITYGISNIIPNGEEFAKTLNSNSTSIGSAVFISEGVYFTRGYFVRVSDQTLVLDPFSTTPSYRIGLFVNEEIITADQDESLYDNSRGFSNYTAPGADRLKISTSLIKKSLTDFNDENFIELLRLENGVLGKIVDKTQYNIIADELARRTYDESGDYYITPFTVIAKNTLNNRIANDGLYFENQLTSDGNIPTDDLLTYKISPGKAYIRGFEVYKDGQSFIDIEKPRTTASVQSEGVSFDCGPTVLVHNTIGQPSVGIATTAFLSLRDERRGIGVGVSGSEIGVARAYDFSLVNSTGITTTYQIKLFDVQTYTTIGLSTNINLPQSTLIEGKTSGAKGYLKNSVSNSTNVTLYNVTGSFAQNESISVSGISTYGHVIKSIRDYKLSDVKSIFSYRDTAVDTAGFNSDVLLDASIPPNLNIVNAASQVTIPSFTISAKDPNSGICTLTSSTTNFIGVATVGNIISYSRPGFSTITFNKISSISDSGRVIGLSSVTSVTEVCDGDTTPLEINTSQLSIRSSRIQNVTDPSFTSTLSKLNVSTIDTENTDIVVKRQYNIASFSSNTIIAPTTDTDFIYQPFDKERYCISYSDGRLENLTSDKFSFTNGFKNLEIKNLSVASGSNATLIVSLKKNKVKNKVKKFVKADTLVINRSSNTSSGIGNTTLNDGLNYSPIYGTRIQDNEISLNVPDVTKILGIFESLDINDPSLPSITFVPSSLNGPNKLATDLIIGENAIGSESGSVAIVISKTTSSIEIVYLNRNQFIPGEIISFKDSGITGTCNAVFSGDKNITSNYTLDNGQRLNYYDFSRIQKSDDNYSPTKKIKIIFQRYNVESSDSGDVYTVDSYPIEEYSNIGTLNGNRLSDLIDIRPRVSSYDTNSTISPFEFKSRVFNGSGQSSQYQLSPNETFITSFSYYQPRIDKLLLSKDGNFQLQKGIPSDFPSSPKNAEGLLEIATIVLPAYLYNVSDVRITYATHKRYRMEDISRLESRIANLEYYTQLSLLEVSTDSLSIKTNGLDRFKCGFFVDNFKSHSAHDTLNPIFRSSIDSGKGYLRPSHYTTAIDLIGQSVAIGIGITEDTNVDYRYEENAQDENIRRNKKIITLDYTEKVFAKNEFATRIENVTPFLVTSYTGTIELNPSSDTWVNTNKISANRVTIEGSYNAAIQQLNIDQKTGFSPIDWRSWQTDWIGVNVSTDFSVTLKNEVIGETKERFTREEQIREQGGLQREGTRITKGTATSTTTADRLNVGSKVRVQNFLNQSREGIRWNVVEQIDSQMLGPRIVNNEFIRYMRARNIEFIARKLKPNTQVYSFFDNVDVNSYSFPKLLEIDMLDKTFQVGETVKAYDPSNTSQVTAIFRIAQLNHKYGPYNSPTTTYTTNPYDTTSTIASTYTSSTTLLNVDTASLEEAAVGKFYGLVKNQAILVGETSGARAKVNNVRLVTDDVGTIIGSFFVPETSAISFETGIKKFKLTNIKDNNPIPGSINSTAEEEFYSQGLLQTSQDTELGIRNAKISKEVSSQKRSLSASDTNVTQTSQYLNRQTTVEEKITSVKEVYKDPLAQSFIVDEPNGIFVTKLDVFFYAKPTSKIPITVQLRPIETGLPTSLILPFSEIELLPDDITTSSDGTSPTTVVFNAPVFLENGKEYAIVLLSDSTDYQVWISRMGEEDITTRNQPESAKKIVSQQPTLGSLFKSQNGSTWEPSSYDDLKFTLYKAVFTKDPGTFSFYNPIEGGDYNTFSKINPNNFSSVSNKIKLGLSTSISTYAGIVPGVSIGITDKSIAGNLIGIAGSVSTINVSGIGLTSYAVGSGYTTFRYDNLVLDTITGEGSGLTVNAYFANGKLDLSTSGIVTVTNGGYGYRIGDIVGIPTSVSFGSGAQLSVQQLGSFNTLILDNVQGNYDNSIGNRLTYQTSSGITSYVGLATVSFIEQNASLDGYHFKVKNYNHGMYSTNNLVRINNLKSDLKPSKLLSNYSSSETSNIQLDSISIFNNFENVGVSTTNPGYVRIQDELISYTGVNTSTNTLTGIVRGIDADLPGTGIGKATAHNNGDSVMKYEFNGVSLRRINRVHNMASPLATVPNSIDIDEYHIKIDMSDTTYGTNRINNTDGLPNLYFNETKTGSNFNYAVDEYITSSKNIIFSTITPNVNTFTPKGTGVGSRIRTISATSVDGSELSFNDQGFESIEINNINELSSMRMVANKDNEDSALSGLPGKKSFTFVLDLFTADENVSPVIDMERVNMILTSNRINKPLSSWPGSGPIALGTKKEYGDPHSAVYISNEINLANSATSLKVLLSAYRPNTCEIKVMYKLIRKDSDDLNSVYEFFPGYENINENGQIIDPTKNTGSSDQLIDSSSTTSDFKDYEFTVDQLPEFDGFSIKIIMTGTDQSKVPFIKDLRAIALA